MKKRNLTIQVFNSFEEEARAEYARRSQQTPNERMKEFSALQAICWGDKWTNSKMEHQVSFEKVAW